MLRSTYVAGFLFLSYLLRKLHVRSDAEAELEIIYGRSSKGPLFVFGGQRERFTEGMKSHLRMNEVSLQWRQSRPRVP